MSKFHIPDEEFLSKPIYPTITNVAGPSYRRVSTSQSPEKRVTVVSGSYSGQRGILLGKDSVYVYVKLANGIRIRLFPEQIE